MTLRQLALDALLLSAADEKCQAVHSIVLTPPAALGDDGQIVAAPDTCRLAVETLPGRAARPALVPPAQLARRPVNSVEGRAALIHSLAHIELNAVNLALDIVWRFDAMPADFYRQWIGVAGEEARHFSLLSEHLQAMGYAYGDFPAHDGLWEMAERTSNDVLARLALVPRTLEARGLDAAPPIRDKLKNVGDQRGAAILAIILADEIGHVAIGNRWYRWLCTERGLDPVTCYAEFAQRYRAPRLRGPFNLEARRAAGFDERELAALQAP
ncbi:ferritin-like domain-containing protein [Candidatus Accumulibacter sp. ACC007]|uniref:ferritin-like domain-containing protein n=1 Tax=Candidatus Accumulibacter sp. ACC007 TaxID=2823333 RepID=UPI0025C34808|nr:ferritin-like domain-containing protein [Candidatus Accumulibacter sp. ACC007]